VTAQSPSAFGATSQPGESLRLVGVPRAGPGPVSEGRSDEVTASWAGELELASAPVLTSALRVLSEFGVRTVMLDLSLVTFMDCTGLGALLDADSRLEEDLRLVRPSRPVLWLLSLVGLSDRFAITEVSTPPTSIPDTKATIEQSKGMIMASYGCTLDQAEKILLSTALRQNVQVQVLAALLVTVTASERRHLGGGQARAVQQVMESTSTRA
jgi:anti-anti-sigma factor